MVHRLRVALDAVVNKETYILFEKCEMNAGKRDPNGVAIMIT
jgi:hypothetical protein